MRRRMVKLHGKMRVEYRDASGASHQGGGMTPELQYWVLATLIQGSVEGFEVIQGPLSRRDKDQFLAEMHTFGSYFGLRENFGPKDWEGFQAYYQGVLDSGILGSDPVSRDVAQQVAQPSRPHWLRWLMKPWGFLFSELLPHPINERLGFHSTRWRRVQWKVLQAILPGVVKLCPPVVRYPKPYRKARKAFPGTAC